jgi:hypothetical protein
MLALIMPAINWLFGGVLQSFFKQWLTYKTNLATSKEAGAVVAMQTDAQAFVAIATSEVQIDALKVQVYGTFTYRLITLLVGLPVALHFSLIFVDTILAAKFFYGHSVIGMPNPPDPYPTYEWYIIASFFLVHTVGQGTGNLTKWLKSAA